MEVTITRRGGSGGSELETTHLQRVVDRITTGCPVTNDMTLTRVSALPAQQVTLTWDVVTGVTITRTGWPLRIPGELNEADVYAKRDIYLWQLSETEIAWYADADMIPGMPETIHLAGLPRITTGGESVMINNGGGAWRMYIKTGTDAALTFANDTTAEVWILGGGGSGGGNYDGTSTKKYPHDYGSGGGGGGYRKNGTFTFAADGAYTYTIGAGGSQKAGGTGNAGANTRILLDGEVLLGTTGGKGGGVSHKEGEDWVPGDGGNGGSGGGGGGKFRYYTTQTGGKGYKGGAGGTNGNAGKAGGHADAPYGTGGTGSGVSGYAFGESTFDGVMRGSGGDGGGSSKASTTVTAGGANTGKGGHGANAASGSKGAAGGSGLIILRSVTV